jgi:hypothetical protein
MSEWFSVLAVFWALWALDGVKLGRVRLFSLGGLGPRWRIRYSRWSRPGLLPFGARVQMADVPLALSPAGVCNVPVGAAGRPTQPPAAPKAWRWAEVRDVGVAQGWIFINGQRFCADSGHVTAPQLLALAGLAPDRREGRIRRLVGRWFRVDHLRRRLQVLRRRTRLAAALNSASLAGFAGITIYIGADVASHLSPQWSTAIANALPVILIALLLLHVAAMISAWRAARRLRPVGLTKRGANLFSAALLPPQAMRLRTLLAEGYFPAQHPLAAILAFGGATDRAAWAFHAIADRRWPLLAPGDALGRDITQWFGSVLDAELGPRLAAAGVSTESLLAAPVADAPASCSYCPRCRDQFVAGSTTCPHGIALQPVRRS